MFGCEVKKKKEKSPMSIAGTEPKPCYYGILTTVSKILSTASFFVSVADESCHFESHKKLWEGAELWEAVTFRSRPF